MPPTSVLRTLGLGQCVSLLIAGTGIFATFLSRAGANSPTIMSCLNYLFLSLYLVKACFSRSFCDRNSLDREAVASPYNKFEGSDDDSSSDSDGARSGGGRVRPSPRPPSLKLYWYLFAAFLDVQANFLVLLAYNYTTITSIMLLDCFTVPSAMVFSHYFLACKYSKKHVIGAAICVIGLGFIILGDSVIHNDRTNSIVNNSANIVSNSGRIESALKGLIDDRRRLGGSSSGGESRALIGDLFCVSGAVLYAGANVLQEYIVKTTKDREGYLGRMGGFAAIIAFIQFWIVDYSHFDLKVYLAQDVLLYLLGFVTCLFLMYTLTSHFLLMSDATLFNLSLLSSDIYAVVFAFFMFKQSLSFMYFIAFVLVVVGLIIYHREHSPLSPSAASSLASALEGESDAGSPQLQPGLDAISSSFGFNGSADSKFNDNAHSYNIISPMAE